MSIFISNVHTSELVPVFITNLSKYLVPYFKLRRPGDSAVYMWFSDCAFKAQQDTFMMRVIICWTSGKLKVECLNYLYYKKYTLRLAVRRKVADTEVYNLFFPPCFYWEQHISSQFRQTQIEINMSSSPQIFFLC